MTRLSFEKYPINAAFLGECNPLPDISDESSWQIARTQNITPEMGKYMGWGRANNILPYLMQDNYDRDKKLRLFDAAILENDRLKAVFLPNVGGKLWSLYDKTKNRELLYKNSVFQPGNLALRNAWTSGGVEWNIGLVGHSPFTCSRLFTAKSKNQKGEPVLSMYEYERRRGLSYGINAYLPDDSDILYVRVVVENTSRDPAVMYWWSNIAFPETPKTRVIVPTDYSFSHTYEQGKFVADHVKIPYVYGKDISYPYSEKRARDYFFDIPPENEKWICAVDGEGKGLLHGSTSRLISRKLFLWGSGVSGDNWNRFLSVPGERYIEIQAGVAHTQWEHIPMPADTVWAWTEAYTAADLDPQKAHGDWQTARAEANALVYRKFPSGPNKDIGEVFSEIPSKRELVCNGSGWGAFENLLRARCNRAPVSRIYDYPACSMNNEQREWVRLLETGKLEPPCDDTPPFSYTLSPYIQNLLEQSPEDYYTLLHLGVMYIAFGQRDKAQRAWERSLELKPTPWAARNLAMLYKNIIKDPKKACEYMLKAVSLAPDNMVPLIRDAGRVLVSAGRGEDYLRIYDGLSQETKKDGRIALYAAHAYLQKGDYQSAAEIVNPDFVLPDNKEGEVSLSDSWFEIYRHIAAQKGITDPQEVQRLYPLPPQLDFRMDHE